jgi:hypothetical protein
MHWNARLVFSGGIESCCAAEEIFRFAQQAMLLYAALPVAQYLLVPDEENCYGLQMTRPMKNQLILLLSVGRSKDL